MKLIVVKFPSGWWGVKYDGIVHVAACKNEHEAFLQAKQLKPLLKSCDGIVNERGEEYV